MAEEEWKTMTEGWHTVTAELEEKATATSTEWKRFTDIVSKASTAARDRQEELKKEIEGLQEYILDLEREVELLLLDMDRMCCYADDIHENIHEATLLTQKVEDTATSAGLYHHLRRARTNTFRIMDVLRFP